MENENEIIEEGIIREILIDDYILKIPSSLTFGERLEIEKYNKKNLDNAMGLVLNFFAKYCEIKIKRTNEILGKGDKRNYDILINTKFSENVFGKMAEAYTQVLTKKN